jgi:peptidoglycan/LPS O-acetylase OafA/YrhL
MKKTTLSPMASAHLDMVRGLATLAVMTRHTYFDLPIAHFNTVPFPGRDSLTLWISNLFFSAEYSHAGVRIRCPALESGE